ncbi:MAG TPA: ABC transporter ATP-binding protein [Candidatus Baltobacteraceae bacterium]|nr:ABC transporter ATP-binding protein [Candidatus Baltobacteraceae bacterium]
MDDTAPARLSRVTKRYGAITALRDVELALRPGETLALLGPNGAGKTTAIRTLLGVISPDAGSATLFGRDPRVAANRRRVGAMLQVAGVPAMLTVAEHIRLFSSYYPRPLALEETLAIAGLSGLANRRYGDLSGGQKQRVSFALAICGDPDALVLDEPTSALDVDSRRALWEHIRAYVARGRSILLTTHDLAEADALADRVAVLLHGRIVAEGTAAQIKARAGGWIVRCSSGFDDARLRAVEGVDAIHRDGATIRISTHAPDSVVRALYVGDPTFTLLDVGETPLEEAFLAITRTEPALAAGER